MTYSGIDLKELAPKVMGMLEGTGTYVSTVGYYCNALQNESQLHDLEYAIDNRSSLRGQDRGDLRGRAAKAGEHRRGHSAVQGSLFRAGQARRRPGREAGH